MNPSDKAEEVPTARTLEETVAHLIKNRWQRIEVASVGCTPYARPEESKFFLGIQLELVIQSPESQKLRIEVHKEFGYFPREPIQQAQRFSDEAYAEDWSMVFYINSVLAYADFFARLINHLNVRGYSISTDGNPTDGVELAPKLLAPYVGWYTPIAAPTN